jgi:hypothetical protein
LFTKLDLTHDLPEQGPTEVLHQFGKTINGNWVGISYYKVDKVIEEKLKSLLPEKYRHLFEVNYMVINSPYIPPHTDNKISTTINFYVNTADAVTKFHTKKYDVQLSSEKLPEQSNGRLYKPEELDIVSEFIAKPNEVYLLDVQKIHSVHCNKQENRTAYCVQSLLSFEKCLEIFNAGMM